MIYEKNNDNKKKKKREEINKVETSLLTLLIKNFSAY